VEVLGAAAAISFPLVIFLIGVALVWFARRSRKVGRIGKSRGSKASHVAAAFLMFFFAAFALVVALAFGWHARRYPMQDHYRTAGK
jgi:hypothetical protein